MTQLLSPHPDIRPPASRCCDRTPCFQAWLEITGAPRQTRLTTELCARHWGEAVQALQAWARARNLAGKLTVLVISQPSWPRSADPSGPFPDSFVFSTIQLTPTAPDGLEESALTALREPRPDGVTKFRPGPQELRLVSPCFARQCRHQAEGCCRREETGSETLAAMAALAEKGTLMPAEPGPRTDVSAWPLTSPNGRTDRSRDDDKH
jgi:hypothetical protein